MLQFHTFNTSPCTETRFVQISIRICIVGMIVAQRRKHTNLRSPRGMLSFVSVCHIRVKNIDFVVFECAVTMRQLVGHSCKPGSLNTQLEALPPCGGEPRSEPSFTPNLTTSTKYPLIHSLGSRGKLSSRFRLPNHSGV